MGVSLFDSIGRQRITRRVTYLLYASAMAAIAVPAQAQPAPDAHPFGAVVSAGTATVSQAPGTTTINQSTQRAAIDWQRFDVGTSQSVMFNQPSASAVTLNRVVGPDPSQIAGHITANGQIVLVNPAGVVFYKGAQVNTAGLMVSAAGISNSNFMSGIMKFDQPALPNARVENQGQITIQQAGLAALVAPQVANSGVISAKLGHVVLAGARTATLDLYGDGLLSLDVTNEVNQTPTGPDGKQVTTLVTNTGKIVAEGGTVQLTARAADGIVQNLVDSAGQISTASLGGKAGSIVLNGIGGSITVEGELTATGINPGSAGGSIEVATARGNTVINSSADLNASGQSGGGVIAVGTTLDRAQAGSATKPAMIAQNVLVAAGARISADALNQGGGGRVVILGTDRTDMAGSITAKGGPQSGNGGFVEISGAAVSLTGHVDASAPLGASGTLLLDPSDLYISDIQPAAANGTTISWVSPSTLEGQNADISLAADNNLFVAASYGTGNTLDLGTHSLTLTAGSNLTVDRGFTIDASAISLAAQAGNITLSGSSGVAAGLITAAQLGNLGPTSFQASNTVQFPYLSDVSLTAGGQIDLSDAVFGSNQGYVGAVDLSAGGNVTQSANGQIFAYSVQSSNGVSGSVSLLGTANQISSLDGFTAGGDFELVDSQDLGVYGSLQAANISLQVGTPGGGNTLSLGSEGSMALEVPTGGRISLVADSLNIANYYYASTTLIAPSGTIEIAPRTPGLDVVFAEPQIQPAFAYVPSANSLVISSADLQAISPEVSVLRIGRSVATTSASAANIVFAEPVDLTGIASRLELDATGAILQNTGATVKVGTLSGQAASATLTEANSVGALNALNVLGDLSLTNAQSLDITGSVSSLGNVLFDISGSLTETGGSLTAPSLSGQANAVTLTGSNAIASLGSFSASGGFTLDNAQNLTISGPLTAGPGGTFNVAGNIGLSGDITADALSLAAQGTIIRSAGTLNVGTLTGQAVKLADFGTGANVSILGPFSVTGSEFALANGRPLTITGPLSAEYIAISAVGQITLNGTIATKGVPLSQQLNAVPTAPGSYLWVLPDAAGSGRFVQAGTVSLSPLNSSAAILRIQIPSGGLASFSNFMASSSYLVLGLDRGKASGTVRALGLFLIGSGGGATLFGTVQGIAGPEAAGLAKINPAVDYHYTFNGCTIGLTLCANDALTNILGGLDGLLPSAPNPPLVLPTLALLAIPVLPAPPHQLTSPDVVPPNISDSDY